MSVSYDSLLERVSALKHDLGKYVAWRSANLDDQAWGAVNEELVGALRADILETRRHQGTSEAAWDVWARLTDDLPKPFDRDELRRVDRAVERLRRHEALLVQADREGLVPVADELRQAQMEIRNALRDLQRALRREEG